MVSSAVLSECKRYRWRLERHVGAGEITAAVFGINPSTADASTDDQTVRKWRGFGQRLGWGQIIVGNVFSFRATDVHCLAAVEDPFGPEHHAHQARIIEDADILVPCWGSRTKIPRSLHREVDGLAARLAHSGKSLMCWGVTASGDPKHPLTLGYRTELVPWHP